MSSKLQKNSSVENPICSATNVKFSNKGCESTGSINNSDINYPDYAARKAQIHYLALLNELREVYAIEERIFEENRKIQDFREFEQKEAFLEQESAFKQFKEKLLFLTMLQRERNQVDQMEQSLAKEEAKKHKNIKKKVEMARIKKYCQGFVKENTSSISVPKCARCSTLPRKPPTEISTEKCTSIDVSTPSPNSVHIKDVQDRRVVEGSEMVASEVQTTGKSGDSNH
ncbi:uncharacterized protein RCH25_043794 [Pelodytes ibericus]